ncbi:hypothetical protein A3K29_00055 [Candidatus Collierbacteria bacterium RIFOXYB2_FULL_46_14]|nr:MAG: hypothetical protein A3K29_00055 [Candidatus Collierbacteria bacterium RIFOXYB2_FULL_46_14]OGD75574.1 MAG: hypothetical protein A3K43_00055 [Candidatus Collierbacteria bacterium RIFOXYA2_FULL_46_20]OGD76910.1 MAG: hypothetical protein A3K39_00055 [Candidatus Collierbacteria bacterium RIFOXYC2_FULL_43_15]OGD80201.1 MAG: hypothetical protein A2320_00545 [Pseudomonadales bacterium GWC2_63_15]OGD81632.1 MAG: hypothetical protein A3K36_00055 [Candidatus Collierbacteria bacterium RIFOXYD2_FUL
MYFAVGFLEMFMATQRTYWISKGRSRAAALLVFFESFVAMFVIYQVATNLNNNFLLIAVYSVGNAIGTYVNLEKVPF